MFPPFPEELAREKCHALMAEMDLDHSLIAAKGTMYGILVCHDAAGKEVVLKAFSGQADGKWEKNGWVPPLLDVNEYLSAVQKNDETIHYLSRRIAQSSNVGDCIMLRKKRLELTKESLRTVYDLYRFPCIDGHKKTFGQMFSAYRSGKWLPPTGTGDCCEPKLLGYAFSHNLVPVSMAEFYYHATGRIGQLHHKAFYPPCDGRCGLILPEMLGLNILYRDDAIVVVNKKAGLLSVPGRGEENQDCVVNRLKRLFPDCIDQPGVHRLDQDTSGILILALTSDAHRNLSMQFQAGSVQKEYIGVLRGKIEESPIVQKGQKNGRIELAFRLDPDNRPHQVYDAVNGKVGITLWEKIRERRIPQLLSDTNPSEYQTFVRFKPLTGRTHQIRLACADSRGFGIPLVGDRLYGSRREGERLMLHASHIEFNHPVTGRRISFDCQPDFM